MFWAKIADDRINENVVRIIFADVFI